MHVFCFTKLAEKALRRLDSPIQERILMKLQMLKTQKDIESAMKKLVDFSPATHRLRIGDYRLILEKVSSTEWMILDVGHRSSIYQ